MRGTVSLNTHSGLFICNPGSVYRSVRQAVSGSVSVNCVASLWHTKVDICLHRHHHYLANPHTRTPSFSSICHIPSFSKFTSSSYQFFVLPFCHSSTLPLLPFCLSAYLPFYLSTFLPSCLSAFLPFCLSAFLPLYLTTFLPVFLSAPCAILPFCRSAFLPFCLSAIPLSPVQRSKLNV